MLWAALLLSPQDGTPPPTDLDQRLRGVAVWALQFTPRVSIGPGAVVMEVEASVRLFRGRRALRDRVVNESAELGVVKVAWATTSLAALALARAGIENGFRRPLDVMLDELPMTVLDAVVPHALTLSHIGCRQLGDVRKLPRSGISRRFDKLLLCALDQAYGLQPEVHEWVVLPDVFHSRLELPSRVEQAPALLFGARRLLLQLAGWLAAKHAGTTAVCLRWAHDAMRSKAAGAGGELTVRTAELTRNVEHLCRLLSEHLAKVELLAPVGELELLALDVRALQEDSLSLLPEAVRDGESLHQVLERLAARLGPDRVLRPVLREDHRLEWMCRWQPAEGTAARHSRSANCSDLPQPSLLLDQPLKLAVRSNRPYYQGPLRMLLGPQRVEGGWWDRDEGAQEGRNVVRDYWVAFSEHAGVLLVFQARPHAQALLDDKRNVWFLHGHFA